jgi:hypothetical protein
LYAPIFSSSLRKGSIDWPKRIRHIELLLKDILCDENDS